VSLESQIEEAKEGALKVQGELDQVEKARAEDKASADSEVEAAKAELAAAVSAKEAEMSKAAEAHNVVVKELEGKIKEAVGHVFLGFGVWGLGFRVY
jgi:hypothetical protein